uniref:Uncharacterized protein n=1 Tax=Anguilla anguilla TaxID=7936 RepID=A0A0E9T9M8_ANGAN
MSIFWYVVNRVLYSATTSECTTNKHV